MAADLKAGGWLDLFQVDAPDKLTLPEELTPKWWDKKKQLLAKSKSTGIGELLTQLGKDLGGVDFARLPIHPAQKQEITEKIEKQITASGVGKFRKQLLAVNKSAVSWSKEFKKASSTKKTAEALDEMAEAASKLAEMLEEKELNKALEKAGAEWTQAVGRKLAVNLETFVTQLKKRLETMDGKGTGNGYMGGDIIPAYHAYDKDRTPAKLQIVAAAMTKYGRTLTTPLGQLIKINSGGIPIGNFDLETAKKLYVQLEVFGADADGKFLDGLEGPDVALKIADLAKLGSLCKKAFSNVEVKL